MRSMTSTPNTDDTEALMRDAAPETAVDAAAIAQAAEDKARAAEAEALAIKVKAIDELAKRF